MLKVLLVDDEPFILQGLKLLVDWEKAFGLREQQQMGWKHWLF